MQWWEVQRFIDGIRRRNRPSWEQTRWLGWVVSRILGSKIDEPEDMISFPWEIETIDPEQLAKETAELIAACKAENMRNSQKIEAQK